MSHGFGRSGVVAVACMLLLLPACQSDRATQGNGQADEAQWDFDPAAPREYVKPVFVMDARKIVEAPFRAVWMYSTDNVDGNMYLPHWKLAGYDSRDGKGMRFVMDREANYFMPMLTGDGRRVVYTDKVTDTVYCVNFDGTNLRKVCAGMVLETWRDHEEGREYILVQRGEAKGRQSIENPVYKIDLDNPDNEQIAWDQTPVTFNNLQMSKDGKRVAIESPWPRCISAGLPNGEWTVFGRGCYPSMAPDNSYITWHMDGAHRNLWMFTPSGNVWWELPINDIPGYDGRRVHQPRWSNHVRYMAVTGPRNDNDQPPNPEEVDIFIGRFSEDLRQIEAWAQLSDNEQYEMFPDVWVQGGELAAAPRLRDRKPPTALAATDQPWPGKRDGLVFLWENAVADNQFTDPATGQPRDVNLALSGLATYGPRHSLDLSGGEIKVDAFSQAVRDAVAKSNEVTIELIATADSESFRDSGGIVSMYGDSGGPEGFPGNFVMEKWRDGYHAYLRHRTRDDGSVSGQWNWLGKCEPGKPTHLVLVVRGDRMVGYCNGVRNLVSVDFEADFSVWKPYPLRFGQVEDDHTYRGLAEHIAIYSRAMAQAEVLQRWHMAEKHLVATKPPRQITVQARLLDATTPPDPKAIAPYRRCLVENRYAIEQVIEGACDASEVVVAQWAIMDGKPIKSIGQYELGKTYRLELSPFAENTQLKGERIIVSAKHADLPRFYLRSRGPLDLRTDAEKFRDAIMQGELDVVKELIEKNPKLVHKPIKPENYPAAVRPIDLAADHLQEWHEDSLPILDLLIAHGAPMDIHLAARAGKLDLVKQYLKDDPKLLEARDARGRTPLQCAAVFLGYFQPAYTVADYLLDQGAKPGIFYASQRGDVELLKKLLAADPKLIEARDYLGSTPLHWTARPLRGKGDTVQAMRMLLEAGADPKATETFGDQWTTMHWVADWSCDTDQIDLLLKHGADINATSTSGHTPLDVCRRGNVRKHLKEHGAKQGEKQSD